MTSTAAGSRAEPAGGALDLVWVNLAIAAAYFAFGKLGLLMALPPGYATAIWPPAGIAAGACLIWGGRRTWPGIVAGSFAVNATLGDALTPSAMALAIALGSMLQALLIERVLRRISPALAFDSPSTVLHFSAASAATCVIAAAIGSSALFAAGAIGESQLPSSFATWWAGDVLGVQIFTPVTLLLFDRRDVWHGRRRAVAVPLLLAFLLCVLVYRYVRADEEQRLTDGFRNDVERLVEPLRKTAEIESRTLEGLTSLFRASTEVTSAEFARYATPLIADGRGWNALAWAPYVAPSQRDAYARESARLLGTMSEIRPIAADGAASRAHVPITYVAPADAGLTGLDLNSEAVRTDAIQRAAASDRPVLSGRIALYHDPDGPGGVLMMQAITDAVGQPTGFVVGMLDLRRIVAGLGQDPALAWSLLDGSDGRILAAAGDVPNATPSGAATLDRDGVHYSEDIAFADRTWRVAFHKPQAALAAAGMTPSTLMLFLALAACGVLGNVVLTTSGDRRRIAVEVAQKTVELSREIEQRRAVQARLLRSERRYRDALDTVQMGTWSLDPASSVVTLDSRARLHHDVIHDAMPLARFLETIRADQRRHLADRIEALGAAGTATGDVHRCEVETAAPDGAGRVLELTLQAWYAGDGPSRRLYRIAGTSHDVTERKRSEQLQRAAREAAEAAVRSRVEFAANISHELRTPMNGILGMLALVLDSALTTRQRERLLLVQDSARSLLRLLNDILDFSRFEAGGYPLAPEWFDLREALGAQLQCLAEQVQPEVALHLRIAPRVPHSVEGDRERLLQIVTNLVGNATKFTQHGEIVVDVDVAARDGSDVELRISVADTGIGILPAAQQRIFQPFSQADSSITRRYGGTGLGLSICRQIVGLMGGRMWLDSTPGAGSTFHFTCRVRAVLDEADDAHDVEGLRLLLVGSCATTSRIVAELAESWGMAVAHAPHVDDACACDRSIDAVVVDVTGCDAAAASAAARTLRDRWGDARIVALLSHGAPGDLADRVLQSGADATVQQPIRSAVLRDALGKTVPGDASTPADPPAVRAATVLRVLVADDHPVNQQIASAVLERHGHRVSVADDGLDVVDLYARECFDVVLMDVQMPGLDGCAATRAIRDIEAAGGRTRARIVAVTASAQRGERERLLAAGMDDYLAKPYALDELAAAVAAAAPAHATAPPAHTGASPVACFDRDDALRRCLDDPALLARVARTFVATQVESRRRLRAALEPLQLAVLEHEAHRLKGAAASLSGAACAQAAADLESVVRDGRVDAERVALLVAKIDAEVQRLLAALRTDIAAD